jgi:calcineurin-like phosphoesterase family protein
MATILIGDVHGCLDELQELVARCATGRDDRIVLVGDLVAKGPDSIGVVRWARETGAAAVLGNHDAAVLRIRRGEIRPGPPSTGRHGEIAAALTDADFAWLAARPLHLRLDDAGDGRSYVVVHAGLVPGVPIDAQASEHLLNLRSIRADGTPSKRLDGAPWASRWQGPEHAVFGHDAVRGLQRHPFATGLDSGCVYGRELTALVLPAGEIVSVSARRAYAAPQAEA